MKRIEKDINDYLVYCEKVRRMSPVTIATKRSVLLRFVQVTRARDLTEVDDRMFRRWVEYLTGCGVSGRSVNIYNATVVAMVKYFVSTGVQVPIRLNLIGKLKEKKCVRKFYTAAEVERVVRGCTDEWLAIMIRIMFETGMRIAEVAWLEVRDFDGRRVRFVGKGRKQREVYITMGTLEKLREYVKRYEINGYLWCVNNGVKTLNGAPMTINTIRIHLKSAFLAAGFPGFYPHALRHSFATDLQVRGASVAEIKEMIGHENIATTERYLHGFEGKMEELFDKYRG